MPVERTGVLGLRARLKQRPDPDRPVVTVPPLEPRDGPPLRPPADQAGAARVTKDYQLPVVTAAAARQRGIRVSAG